MYQIDVDSSSPSANSIYEWSTYYMWHHFCFVKSSSDIKLYDNGDNTGRKITGVRDVFFPGRLVAGSFFLV